MHCIKLWKRMLLLLLAILMMTGCAIGTKAADKNGSETGGQNKTGTTPAVMTETKSGKAEKMTTQRMLVKLIYDQKEIVFELNETSVSRSFYQQLPLTVTIENYSNNEKVFQPPRKLNCEKAQEGDCPAGSIAYFSPWNNVCLYYGNAPRYSGLYVMGKAVKNAELIRELSGKVKVEASCTDSKNLLK